MSEADLENPIEGQLLGADDNLHPGDLVLPKPVIDTPLSWLTLRYIAIYIVGNWLLLYRSDLGVVAMFFPLFNLILSLIFIVQTVIERSVRTWPDILLHIATFISLPLLLVGGVFLLVRYNLMCSF